MLIISSRKQKHNFREVNWINRSIISKPVEVKCAYRNAQQGQPVSSTALATRLLTIDGK